ncbi:helix-turn-helix transcriptional regulator [Microlunatus ginsengisoli]|uniref:WYL domain-containing protein n=1 Tax=Microlunatus ginsengisoli TaxID=363863 RepID=A0ABP6ZP05_9ACTN
MPIFADRVAELPRLLDALQYHPGGLRIEDLAREVQRTPQQVREALLAYYTTDFAQVEPNLIGRPPAIEFLSGTAESDDDDPATASVVRLITDEPERELGVDYLPVTELARLYRAGRNQLELDPGNEVLASAVEKLRRGLLPGVTSSGPPLAGERPPGAFARARREQRKVKISYARAWRPGVRDRVIEPYRMIRTRRGWEIDAGPPDDQDRLRTYLLPRVQDFEVLDERFVPPPDLDALLARQRALTKIEMIVPHETRWAVEKYAEQVEVIAENPRTARLRVHLLEPVRFRVGLVLLDGGTRARVVSPAELAGAGRELARVLLAHYDG